MRVTNLQARTALLACLSLAASSCQTAQKPVPLLPPASAPSLRASAPVETSRPTPAKTQQAAASSQIQNAQQSLEVNSPSETAPAVDPIGDLILGVEKQYQAGLAD